MTSVQQFTYWSMTLNNPTEADMVLIRNPNDRYVREFIWTQEVGEEGTPHIQAWVRLQRNQTLKFMTRLYPRAHFKPCSKDDHNQATHDYAQKEDDTTAGRHHIVINDPQRDVLGCIEDLCDLWFIEQWRERYAMELFSQADTIRAIQAEWDMEEICRQVRNRKRALEEHYVEFVNIRHSYLILSPSYERMWERFGNTIIARWWKRKWSQFLSETVEE